MKRHYRAAVPLRAGERGRVACGRTVEADHATLVWRKVTCLGCRLSVAWTQRAIAYGVEHHLGLSWLQGPQGGGRDP